MADKSNSANAYLVDGNITTLFVPDGGIKDISKPTVEELSASTAINLSPWLTLADGFALTHDQNTVNDDREAWSSVGTIPASDSYSNTTMRIINNVNKGEDIPNVAYQTLKRNTKGFIVRRRGKAYDAPFAAGDEVAVYKVTIGIVVPVAAAQNTRQMSTVHFSVDPSSKEEGEAKVVDASHV